MKKLTLIRHAKSSWKYPDLDDYDRPLNKRGRKDAPAMGQRLLLRGFRPDGIISSPALRALRTIEAIAAAIDFPFSNLQIDPLIYGADDLALINLIRQTSPDLEWLAITGHNPETTSLTRRLSGKAIDNVPTCGVVEMHFDIESWTSIGTDDVSPDFFYFDYPKNPAP